MSVYEGIKELEIAERLQMTLSEAQEIRSNENGPIEMIGIAFKLGCKRGIESGCIELSDDIYDNLCKIKRNAGLLSILNDQLTGGMVDFNCEIICSALLEISLNIDGSVDAILEKTCL